MPETAYAYTVRLRRELDGLAGGTLSGSVVETEKIEADKMEDDGNFFVFSVKVGNEGQVEKDRMVQPRRGSLGPEGATVKLREWLDSPAHREVCIGPDESMACCLDLMDDETKDSLEIEVVEPDAWEHPAVLRARST